MKSTFGDGTYVITEGFHGWYVTMKNPDGEYTVINKDHFPSKAAAMNWIMDMLTKYPNFPWTDEQSPIP